MEDREYLGMLESLWKKNWPENLPREIEYPLGEKLLTEYLAHWAETRPDKAVINYYGRAVTFKELDEFSSRFASLLAGRGLKKGDRVAVLMANCPQFLIVFYGILKVGCVHVPVNPLFKEQEFLYEMGDAEPKAIVALDLLYPLIRATREKTGLQTVLVTSLTDFLPENPTLPLPDLARIPPQDCPGALNLMEVLKEQSPEYPSVPVSLDDLAALNYTGGTTGLPKGCEHTQRDMLYTGASAWTFTMDNAGPEDMMVTYLPVFWIAGEDAGIITPIISGGTILLLTRWDALAVMKAVSTYRATIIYGLVDNLVEIMDHPDVGKYDLTSLKTTLVSSFVKKLNVDYRRRWLDLTGSIARESSWGMTETHTIDTFTIGLQKDDMDLTSRPIFVGLPMPGTNFKIVGFDDGRLLPLGEEGEIMVRTPSLMKGYWRRPEATREQLVDGWLHTGDIGLIDEEGFLHFLGRQKEMLKVKGMSVFPSEIEALLGRHPAISGSGVLGREDAEKGQVPVAFVMLDPQYRGKTTAEELSAWCRQNMAGYKVPEIRLLEQLPLTATGKVMKEELKKEL